MNGPWLRVSLLVSKTGINFIIKKQVSTIYSMKMTASECHVIAPPPPNNILIQWQC